MKRKTKHHHHIGAIALIPIALLLTAASWGEQCMSPFALGYESKAERTVQKMQLLDTEFTEMQRAHSLLTIGKDAAKLPSVAYQHFAKKYDSPAEEYEQAKRRTDLLQMRIDLYKNKLKEFGERAVHISIENQMASLIEDGKITKQYPVSSGTWETPTPLGKFQIHRKQELRVSSQEIPYRMPHYMAFTPNQSHGLHALPYLGDKATNSDFWHEARSHIGLRASHGCVRLLPEDAEELYAWIEIGTPLYISA